MSGICGIVNADGAPVERQVLHEMTQFLAYRGPDAQEVWLGGAAGLGHAMLRTTFESANERQPASLDGKVWIAADARIDAQGELKEKLAVQNRRGLEAATDAQLILHAYHSWGEDCVKHLLGDFAFAIWDAPRERLFCARDHFGVKPFFYARIGRGLVFSNTLDCLRRHPGVSSTLNDLAIADFLLFDMNQDPGTTAFAQIQRLPPAHRMTWAARGFELDCYWTLPTTAEIRYRARGDYVDRFRELLDVAVADRLRTRRVAISMSGGLDSPSIAATAKKLLAREAEPFELHAHTLVYDRLIPDREREFSSLVAAKLAIPIHYCVADDYRLYEHFDRPEAHFPEPFHEPEGAAALDFLKAPSAHCRVMLTGWDGDALLDESPKPYFRVLLKQRKLTRLLGATLRYAVSQRRLVPRSVSDRLLRRKATSAPRARSFPPWIIPGLERRFALRRRWEQVNSMQPVNHPLRPYAHRIYAYVTRMSNFFDRYDPGVTRLPLECRHPLVDLRLLDYCLSLPPLPWCVKKEILRSAMQGLLPEAVRVRPKTALGYPGLEMLRRADAQWVDHFVPAAGLDAYVDRNRIPTSREGNDPAETWENLRPLSLNYWLLGLQSSSQPTRGKLHEFA